MGRLLVVIVEGKDLKASDDYGRILYIHNGDQGYFFM
jgi:hypothetical protein